MSEKTKILVCVNCRAAGAPKGPIEERMGYHLYRAMLDAAAGADDVVVEPVECMKVCVKPVTIALASPGKWTCLFGDFPEGATADILDAARRHAASPDGIIPKDEMPPVLKLGQIARVPPV